MCKILVASGISASAELIQKFGKAVSTRFSETERHGIGYAAINEHGVLSHERWVDPKQAFRDRRQLSDEGMRLVLELGNSIIPQITYDASDNVSFEGIKSLILHGRTSTNTVSLKNTHPFVIGDSALIHNGVIDNSRLKNTISTCDSESILHLYLDNNVARYSGEIQTVANELDGYYAFAVLTAGNSPTLDIVKDHKASLSFCVIRELGNAKVWCTSASDLAAVCKKLKFRKPEFFGVRGGYLVRLDPLSGQKIHVERFEPSVVSEYSNVSGLVEKTGIRLGGYSADSDAREFIRGYHGRGK